MNCSNIPPEITALPQWVCVWEDSKIPMQATIRKGASSVNPDTWSTYQEAVGAVKNGSYDYVGFVFNNNGIVGIDIDYGFDADGFLSETSVDIMRSCRSYTERSRSGRGVHILIKGDLPFKGKNNGNGVEIYKSGRYFITTGDKLVYDKIIENQQAIDHVVGKYFADVEKESENTEKTTRFYSPVYDKLGRGKIALRPKYPLIKKGNRNNSMVSIAGQMHTAGYSKKDIYKELLYANSVACNPPLPERDLQTIVTSITKYRRK